MSGPLGGEALDRLFRAARTRNAWVDETLPESTWRELYDLLKFGPTSANSSPARFVFLTSPEAKARLKPYLSEGNHKALAAPCICLVGYDLDFPNRMAELFPHKPESKDWFGGPDSEPRATNAFRNATLQGAYLMLAARALGLDCGPMTGFDFPGVEREFFAGTRIKADFLCALGHGADTPFPRLPRLAFEDACTIL